MITLAILAATAIALAHRAAHPAEVPMSDETNPLIPASTQVAPTATAPAPLGGSSGKPDKIKFPRANVIYCGDVAGATTFRSR